jgi:hypothetical protein
MIRHALGHMISCKDASRLISQEQEVPLSWFVRWKLRMHLVVCDACTKFERQVRFLREAMQKYRE